jgi:hypothetical protein
VFREGLTAIREEILARDPDALPAATSNHCFFCWYVLTRGLAAGIDGGGGQVGNWTEPRPHGAGPLLDLGTGRLNMAAALDSAAPAASNSLDQLVDTRRRRL